MKTKTLCKLNEPASTGYLNDLYTRIFTLRKLPASTHLFAPAKPLNLWYKDPLMIQPALWYKRRQQPIPCPIDGQLVCEH